MKIYEDFERLKTFVQGPFEGFCSPVEFAEIQGVDESAIRHAIRTGRLIPGRHCLKLGKQWVLCKEAFLAWNKTAGYQKFSELRATYFQMKNNKSR